MDHRIFRFATRGQCIKGKKLDYVEHNHVFCFKLQCASIVVLLCTAIWWKSKDAVVHCIQLKTHASKFYVIYGPVSYSKKFISIEPKMFEDPEF